MSLWPGVVFRFMKNAGIIISLLLLSCGTAVEIVNPLAILPDDPSIVIATVNSIDTNNGMLRVSVRKVNDVERHVGGTVWIDEHTLFSNSGGVKEISSWTQITGAEVEIKGQYRGDRYFADEVDVLSMPRWPAGTDFDAKKP